MNSVANGKIREQTPFREVFVQPAAGDNGTGLGAALYVAHHLLVQPRRVVMDHALWGPEFDDGAIAGALAARAEDVRQLGAAAYQIDDVKSTERYHLCGKTLAAYPTESAYEAATPWHERHPSL